MSKSATVSSRRERVAATITAALCTGLLVGASAVDARPLVVVDARIATADVTGAIALDGQALGSDATISGDARFVAFMGAPGAGDAAVSDARTSTVYLTDRVDVTTVEITIVPEGRRPGNSIHPVMAGDGCSVVVTTEIPFDVFRDNDSGLRWDVYRQRLPHCGGASGDWELVSTTSDGNVLARDDVSSTDPAAVARSGTPIVYTHPADQIFDGESLTSLTLVDVTRTVASALRSQPVAGMPVTSPDTEYVHSGIDQPAISGDGRFVAYRSDADSTDAVAGWGYGPVVGGPAARQVFVWDRAQLDPFEAVELVSARLDGLPAVTGASEPSLSRDGRVVAFTSTDVGLSPAVFAPCTDGCPSQVYHLDRDPDLNGRFDEPARTTMSILSSVSATDPRRAGTAPSSQPSVSADGQLVGFVTKATNLQVVPAGGGGEPTDGDILIADVASDTLRRVTMLADGVRPALGAHSSPQLSDTGRTTVFDTLSGGQLVPGSPSGRQVLTTDTPPTLSLADADLGTTLVGLTSEEWYVAVINNGPTTFVPSNVTVSDERFQINRENSTCALGVPVPPGGDCTVRLAFAPSEPGPVEATLTVAESGFRAVSIGSLVRGAGGDPALRSAPAGSDLGSVVVGQTSPEFVFDVENISIVPTTVDTVTVAGPAATDFAVSSNSCGDRSLGPRVTCSIGVVFTPTASGQRTALVEIRTATGQYTVMMAAGQGRYEPTLTTDRSEIEAGLPLGLGGNGFPPSTPISVFLDDDARNRLDLVTNEDGTFLLGFPTSPFERGGTHTVVARAADGTIATAELDVIEQPNLLVGLPGFGLG